MRLKMIPLLDKINYLENEGSNKDDDSTEKYQEMVKSLDFIKQENSDLLKKNEELQNELVRRDQIFKEWNEVVDQLDVKLSRLDAENQGNFIDSFVYIRKSLKIIKFC